MVTLDRVGVDVGHAAVRAIGIRKQEVVWAATIPLGATVPLESLILDLLRDVPRNRWQRPPVYVALGPSWAQLRRLPGIPPLSDAKLVAALVSTNPRAYFLWGTGPQMLARPVRGAAESWWSASVAPATIESIENGVQRARCRLRRVLAGAAILPIALDLGEAYCPEVDQSGLRVCTAEGLLAGVERCPRPFGAPSPLPSPLERCGADAADFLVAFAAAQGGADRRAPDWPIVATDPGRPVPRWRGRLALGAMLAGLGFFLLAPGGLSWLDARASSVRLDSFQAMAMPARAAEAELMRFQQTLTAFRQTAAPGASAVAAVLARIGDALPGGSALTSFRLDSAELMLIVLAPRIDSVLELLDSAAVGATPRIVGPISREVNDGRPLERAVVRIERP